MRWVTVDGKDFYVNEDDEILASIYDLLDGTWTANIRYEGGRNYLTKEACIKYIEKYFAI